MSIQLDKICFPCKSILTVLIICIVTSSCGQPSNSDLKSDKGREPERIGSLSEAIDLIEHKQENKGIEILNYLIRNSKDSLSHLYYLKSLAYYKLQDFQNSTSSVNQSISYDTLNYRSHAVKGDIFQKNEEFDSSLTYYLKAEKGLSNDRYLLNNIGALYLKTGRIDLAKNVFQKLYDIDSNNIDGLYNLSFAYYKLSEFDEALVVVERAILLKRDDSGLYNLRGQICGKKGKTREAIKSFEKSIELKPYQNVAIENLKRAKKMLSR